MPFQSDDNLIQAAAFFDGETHRPHVFVAHPACEGFKKPGIAQGEAVFQSLLNLPHIAVTRNPDGTSFAACRSENDPSKADGNEENERNCDKQ